MLKTEKLEYWKAEKLPPVGLANCVNAGKREIEGIVETGGTLGAVLGEPSEAGQVASPLRS